MITSRCIGRKQEARAAGRGEIPAAARGDAMIQGGGTPGVGHDHGFDEHYFDNYDAFDGAFDGNFDGDALDARISLIMVVLIMMVSITLILMMLVLMLI